MYHPLGLARTPEGGKTRDPGNEVEIGFDLSRNIENVETTYGEFLCATDKELAFEEIINK